VHIYKGNRNNAFVYYEDDGESYNYENGSYYKRTITYNAAKKHVVFGKAEGNQGSKFKHITIQLHGFADNSRLSIDGKAINAKTAFFSFLTPVSSFDPQGTVNTAEGRDVRTITTNNSSNAFTLSY
jgi:alpha-glucosidase